MLCQTDVGHQGTNACKQRWEMYSVMSAEAPLKIKLSLKILKNLKCSEEKNRRAVDPFFHIYNYSALVDDSRPWKAMNHLDLTLHSNRVMF